MSKSLHGSIYALNWMRVMNVFFLSHPNAINMPGIYSKTEITNSNIHKIIQELESIKMIKEIENPGDKRSKIFNLTEKGLIIAESSNKICEVLKWEN